VVKKTRKTKQERRLKEDPRPDGQHSTRVTLEPAWRDKSTTHAYFQQWHSARKHRHSPFKQRTG